MPSQLVNDFHLLDWDDLCGGKGETLTDAERYNRIADWAGKARGKNPGVFDALTEWILDDAQWSDDRLAENEQILMQGVPVRQGP